MSYYTHVPLLTITEESGVETKGHGWCWVTRFIDQLLPSGPTYLLNYTKHFVEILLVCIQTPDIINNSFCAKVKSNIFWKQGIEGRSIDNKHHGWVQKCDADRTVFLYIVSGYKNERETIEHSGAWRWIAAFRRQMPACGVYEVMERLRYTFSLFLFSVTSFVFLYPAVCWWLNRIMHRIFGMYLNFIIISHSKVHFTYARQIF